MVLDEPGKEVAGPFTIEKSPKGFDQLLVKLRKLSDEPTAFKIGVETPHNL
ncbi:MAG: IS110 family transposase [Calditrichaeota bacterium]|nr:IS110 family transposase [Calditrichota bacterium]